MICYHRSHSQQPNQNWYNTCIFSIKHITAFWNSWTLDRTPALCLGAFWNCENTRKHKNVALNRTQRGHLFKVARKQEGKSQDLAQSQVGKWELSADKLFIALRMYLNDREIVVLILELQINLRWQIFTNTECANNEDWQYKESPIKYISWEIF